MYIEKSYHRPRSTWLDSVCRYINDSFGHLTRSHITFLLEVSVCHRTRVRYLLSWIIISQPKLNRDILNTPCTVLNYGYGGVDRGRSEVGEVQGDWRGCYLIVMVVRATLYAYFFEEVSVRNISCHSRW